jgi:hypothetical protein
MEEIFGVSSDSGTFGVNSDSGMTLPSRLPGQARHHSNKLKEFGRAHPARLLHERANREQSGESLVPVRRARGRSDEKVADTAHSTREQGACARRCSSLAAGLTSDPLRPSRSHLVSAESRSEPLHLHRTLPPALQRAALQSAASPGMQARAAAAASRSRA